MNSELSWIPFWLLAWTIGVSVFLVPILVLNFVAEVRSLRREGIPRPVFLILRRVLGLLPLPAGPVGSLAGCDAFVNWDRRWLDGGVTMARVKRASDMSRELELELDRSIGNVRIVTFRPRVPERASYRLSGVRGTLAPAIDDVIATAEVVVYPQWAGRSGQ